MKKWLLIGLVVLFAQPVAAQEDELRNLPGYVPFEELSNVYGEPKVMVNIGNVILSFMSAAAKNDPEAKALFEGLQGIRINVYSTAGEPEPALEQLTKVRDMLKKANWEPVVQVKEPNEQVQIFMKFDGQEVQGLVVMAVDDQEAAFINVLGMIDPDNLEKIMSEFDVDVEV